MTSDTRRIQPRIIIHGGAGNITPANLPPPLYAAHHAALSSIVESTSQLLKDFPDTTALDAACHAVRLLELSPLFNAGRGGVFTRAGRIEHEASVMISTPYSRAGSDSASIGDEKIRRQTQYTKRACATMRTSTVVHPILLAREMLVRSAEHDGGGAGGHNVLAGETAERLARDWELEVQRPSWFWVRKRWEQHRRGMGLGCSDEEWNEEWRAADTQAGWDADGSEPSVDSYRVPGIQGEDAGLYRLLNGRERAVDDCAYAEEVGKGALHEYVPQGTVGAVVLDSFGTICAATSTGGMTNKLPGRVGDTPTIGAGFWAESWNEDDDVRFNTISPSPLSTMLSTFSWTTGILQEWLPQWLQDAAGISHRGQRAVGMSGTGNGDSFLRLCCVRTVAAMARFSRPSPSLQQALTAMAGPGGLLQASAEDRWGRTGEGEGGIIGIELENGKGRIVSDFNCGGMFRAWIDDRGEAQMRVFRNH